MLLSLGDWTPFQPQASFITIHLNTNIAAIQMLGVFDFPGRYHPPSAGNHLFGTWNKCRILQPQLLSFITSALGRKARNKWNEKSTAGSVQEELFDPAACAVVLLPSVSTYSYAILKIVLICVMGGEKERSNCSVVLDLKLGNWNLTFSSFLLGMILS